jgi:hypothetical protein
MNFFGVIISLVLISINAQNVIFFPFNLVWGCLLILLDVLEDVWMFRFDEMS